MAPADFVVLSFDGQTLMFQCAGRVIPLPAEGRAWDRSYRIRVGAIGELPRRLSRAWITVEIWDSALRIGRYDYKGVEPLKCDPPTWR